MSGDLLDRVRELVALQEAFAEARARMNAAIPGMEATRAEYAVYDERYRADHAAEKAVQRAAIKFAYDAASLLPTPAQTASGVEG